MSSRSGTWTGAGLSCRPRTGARTGSTCRSRTGARTRLSRRAGAWAVARLDGGASTGSDTRFSCRSRTWAGTRLSGWKCTWASARARAWMCNRRICAGRSGWHWDGPWSMVTPVLTGHNKMIKHLPTLFIFARHYTSIQGKRIRVRILTRGVIQFTCHQPLHINANIRNTGKVIIVFHTEGGVNFSACFKSDKRCLRTCGLSRSKIKAHRRRLLSS